MKIMNSLVLRFVMTLAFTDIVVLARPANKSGLKIKRSTDEIAFKPTELTFPIEMRDGYNIIIEGIIRDTAEDDTFETNVVFSNTKLENGETKYMTEYCNITLKKMKVTVSPAPVGQEKDNVQEFETDMPLKEEPTFSIYLTLDASVGFDVTTIYKDMNTLPMACPIENFNDLALAYIRFGKGQPSIKSLSLQFEPRKPL